MSSNVEDFIEHYGMKGMQWGVRKKPKPDRRPSSDYKKSDAYRKKHVTELTNKQLKTANERANLEQNFNRLNPGKVAKGHEAVKSVLALAGTAAGAYAMFNSPAGKAVREIGKKKVNQQLKLF